ncbi:MAG: MFS transporter [Actinomycetota bacterium]
MVETPVVNRPDRPEPVGQVAEPPEPAAAGSVDPLIDSGRAWIAAVAVAAANGVGFGIAYSFGTFFDSMAAEFEADRGATALIFGVTLLFFFGFGIVSGPISDRVGPRPLLIAGAVTMVVGLLITSRAGSLPVAIVAYGIGVGIGGGLYIAPLSASVGALFDRRRPAAFSVMAVGNGLAVLIIVPLAEAVIAANDWRRAYVVLAVVAGVIFVAALPAVVMPSRSGDDGRPAEPAPVVGAMTLFRTAGFGARFFVGLLMSVGLFIAFGFIQTFAIDDGVSVSTAARLVSLVGLSSIVGRVGLTALVRPLGAITVVRLALAVQTVAYLIWYVAGGSLPLLVTFVVLFGSAYGGFVAVVPEAGIRLVGLVGLGKSMGLLFLSFGVGGLIGPPLAGWLADVTTGNDIPILLTVGLLAAATLTSALIRSPELSAD